MEPSSQSTYASKKRFLIALICGVYLGFSGCSATVLAQTIPHSLTLTTPIGTTFTFDQHTIESWFTVATRITYHQSLFSEIEHTNACPLESLYCDFFLSRSTRQHTIVTTQKTLTPLFLRDSLLQTNTSLEKEPTNAILGVENNQVVAQQTEQLGFRTDIDQAVSEISSAITTAYTPTTIAVTVPGTILQPTVKSSDIKRLGITDLIAEGTTNFAGSPKNRIFNINRALKQFQGIIIAPGEEFSFVKYLGPVDGENGYLPELVIKNNRTEPEFGGGICQVSSTVFRTAIYAGFKITARRNHAYPVSYYKPYGMDATIYIPNPDLKFINNTPGSIFLQPSVSGTRLTFQMYGTNDGRIVTVDGPHILESNPDGSMRTIFSQEVSTADGQNFIRDSFRSNYKSPSLFPHPDQEPLYTTKPKDWSGKQWEEYQRTHTH